MKTSVSNKYRCDYNLEMNFDKDKDFLLIEMIKQRPLMYDPDHRKYKYMEERLLCWEAISKEIGMSVTACKARWRVLRNMYRVKKIMDSTTPLQQSKLSSWQYTEAMSFMNDKMKTRKHHLNRQIPISVNNSKDMRDSTFEKHFIKTEIESEEDEQPEMMEKVLDILGKIEWQRKLISEKLSEDARVKTPVRRLFNRMAAIAEHFPPREQMEVRRKVCKLVTETEKSTWGNTSVSDE